MRLKRVEKEDALGEGRGVGDCSRRCDEGEKNGSGELVHHGGDLIDAS